MDALNSRYAREFRGLPDADPRRRMRVRPLRDVLVAGTGPLLLTLTAAVAAVLLVACANVAGLFLARALGRRRGIAIRAALGASRVVLVRQVLTESLVLALAGGCAGLILAAWAVRGLGATLTGLLPQGSQTVAGIDVRVLGFTAALSLVTGIVFGLWPAFYASNANLLVLSKGDDAPVIGRIRSGVARRIVVGAQVALTVVLLVTAGLLIRTFWRLYSLDPGFDPRGTVTMNLSLPRSGYATPPQMVAFYEQLLDRVRALGVVQSAACASALPVNPSRASPVLVEGQPVVPLAERPIIAIQMVLGPYFRTMRIPLVRGRVFDERDVATSQPVVIVNEAFTRRFFAGQNPLGRHITLGRRAVPAEIVGVVGDVKNQALAGDPVPEIEVPFRQLAWASMNLIVRTAGDPQSAMGSVRAAIRGVDPNLPATRVQAMEDVLADARSRPKAVMTLLSLFAAAALALATVGLYGLITYSVKQRTHEMGVRLALGAQHADLVAIVVRQGVALAAAGIAAGLAMSFVATRLVANQLYGVKTTDALAFSIGPAIFLGVTALASWIPARRIARVDPSRSLRAE
jgi:putative ABC transport system permease protein